MSINTRGATAHLEWNRWEDLEASYDNYNSTAPYLDYPNNEDDDFSFALNNWLYFYVDMHRLSADTKWLDLAEDTCQWIIDNNDVARFARGDFILSGSNRGVDRYYQAPYPYQADGVPVPGWSSANFAPGLRCQILIDGQVIGAMSYYADYILSNNIAAYETKANSFFAHIKLVIDSHNNSWRYDKVITNPPMTVKGAWYGANTGGGNSTWSSAIAYNHCVGALQAGLLYHKHFTDAEYLNKAEKFIEYMRDTRVDLDDGYFWKYIVSGTKSEDINHGSYTYNFFMLAAVNGYLSFTTDELTRYANSLLKGWQGTKVGDMSERFDGTGDMPKSEGFDPAHLIDFVEYAPSIYKMTLEAHATRSKDYGNYGRMFRGAAALLRYRQSGSLFA